MSFFRPKLRSPLPRLLAAAAMVAVAVAVSVETYPAHGLGAFTSQGTQAHRVEPWHQAGINGQGVKIGIIENTEGGFSGYRDLMGTELPSTVQARCYTGAGRPTAEVAACDREGDHGTIVAETVADVAPNAAFYIANPRTGADLRKTVDWMISEGVSVINHSATWGFDGPPDESWDYSISLKNTVKRAVDAGIVWVNSAGNDARRTWFGPPTLTTGGRNFQFLKFRGDDIDNDMDMAAGDSVFVQMRWQDDWAGAQRDLNLSIVDFSTLTFVAGSYDEQNGVPGDFPIEFVRFTAPRDGRYGVVVSIPVADVPNKPGWVQLIVGSHDVLEMQHYTLVGSITNPAEGLNPGMLAVGAAHWDNTHAIEPYSSRGPTPDERVKPDIVGAACGETSRRPLNAGGFCGTSASSPHVAGLAALVSQKFPNLTPVQVADYLKRHAAQRAQPNPNDTWGYGFAQLPVPLPPISPVVNPITAGPDRMTVSWTPAPDDGREPTTSYDLRYLGPGLPASVDSNWTVIDGLDAATPHQQVVLDLLGSTRYEIQVRGVNLWGSGEWSASAVVTTLPPVVPSSPTGLTATGVQNEAKADLSWKAPDSDGGAPITGYTVEMSAGGEDPWEQVHTTVDAGTAYRDDGTDDDGPMFEIGDSRHYRVSAVNSVGTGPPSDVEVVSWDLLLARYDVNPKNGQIDRAEVIAAINDYLFGEGVITRADVIRLINLYLFG